jgi:hypothetical protein
MTENIKLTYGDRINLSRVEYGRGIPKAGKAWYIWISPDRTFAEFSGTDYGNPIEFRPLYSSSGYVLLYKKGGIAYVDRVIGSKAQSPIYVIGYLFKNEGGNSRIFIFEIREDVGKAWLGYRAEAIERLKDMEERG